ncbi:MAG: MotA/TolQ/ExbB proton channel family protein [Myxococcota bacterium]|nr:MotA/TolQ/ExbB proton channel family protein [Myxococcota bacterium]
MLEQQMFAFALLGGEWVLWLLVALSGLCFAIAIERGIYRKLNTTPSEELQEKLIPFLQGGPAANLQKELQDLKGLEAKILHAGVEAAQQGGIAAAEESIAGFLLFEKTKLERGLIVIGTTGSNAPFIGLFGTVLGIIKAFHDLSLETTDGAASVMSGISEALVATAIGLMVAIPAVVLYNYFQRRNKTQLANIESMAHMVLSRLKSKEHA